MTVDDYINSFPTVVQAILHQIRTTIRENAPGATEGFYATPTGHSEFKKELSAYRHGKGSVQFPLNKPMPFDLIGRIVRFRVGENMTGK